ncbi:hypothetical protein IQ07DRAFT_254969 [Pyrenochaeta sp. DS3sAY3a]|nr:hypothetical protein IQ07DRAFT_254969 [Pyrenochaeta sp. DS3sAY3a]
MLSNASSVASYLRYTHDTRPISCWTEASGLGGGGALGAVRPVNDVTGRGRCGRWRTRELDHHPQFRTHHKGGRPAAPAAALGRADLSYTRQASPSVHSKTSGGSALDVGHQQWFMFGSGGRRGGVTECMRLASMIRALCRPRTIVRQSCLHLAHHTTATVTGRLGTGGLS